MKRIIAALSLLLALSLCGCGDKDTTYVCISETSYLTDGTETGSYTYDYNENGDLIRILSVYSDSSRETTMTYGNVGQLLELIQTYSPDSSHQTITTVYNYYDENDTIPNSCKCYNEDGSIYSTGTYEYDDSTGTVYYTEYLGTGDDVFYVAEFQYIEDIPARSLFGENFFPHLRLMSQTVYFSVFSSSISISSDHTELEWDDYACITKRTQTGQADMIEDEITNTNTYTYEYNEEDLPIKATCYFDGEISGYIEYEYVLLSDYLKGN